MYLKYDNLEQYIGRMFGFWLVLSVGIPKLDRGKGRHRTLTCKCTCGNCNDVVRDVRFDHLISERSKSCGFMNHSNIGKGTKKYNEYNLLNNYGIGYYKDREFYFDLEDYEKIKSYCWHMDKKGYVRTSVKLKDGKIITKAMHLLIFDKFDECNEIDHVNGLPYDNRKINLRECTHAENMKNMKLPTNNTSGYKGVYFDKERNKWMAKICVNGKQLKLGRFKDINDAIEAREKAEEKYFGEYKREEEYL